MHVFYFLFRLFISSYCDEAYGNDIIIKKVSNPMEKILIVEDDITVQEELFSLLKNAGYNAVIIKEFFN